MCECMHACVCVSVHILYLVHGWVHTFMVSWVGTYLYGVSFDRVIVMNSTSARHS